MLISNGVEDGRRGREPLLVGAETDTGSKVRCTAGVGQAPYSSLEQQQTQTKRVLGAVRTMRLNQAPSPFLKGQSHIGKKRPKCLIMKA